MVTSSNSLGSARVTPLKAEGNLKWDVEGGKFDRCIMREAERSERDSSDSPSDAC